MKKLLLLSAFFISYLTFAQVPQGISYQAIALNSSGTPVVSSNVGLRLSILNTSASGTVLYSETQVKTTNAQGLFNLVVGQGTLVSGAFNTINWGSGSKFLKVEMDASGGTNYVLVGTTQLLSVPYALAADSLVTSAGEGITLVSPNGTPYVLSVNDAGQLSLPTSGTSSSFPTQLYMYGSFNSFNASTALLMGYSDYSFFGYKYLTSGTQIKFISENNSSAAIYGINGTQNLVLNGSLYTIPSNGLYLIYNYLNIDGDNQIYFHASSIGPGVSYDNASGSAYSAMTYNVATNTLSATVTGVTSPNNTFRISMETPTGTGYYGDNLSDGTIDLYGQYINFPGATSTPKNYKVDLVLNFNGSGTYTVTQVP
ncbi:cadherin repeat domain-containing protein [Flavobacterium phycosphaerae]|uniref:hypothetical protein n=1 Tax=Flavobacterium phycosphaerae TaxID=2697515 RepID=UPI00138B143A|nr:hypothetical protein [Flavobacterium phycosphaerae]